MIGRIVAFRDPILAQWAWTHGRKQLVIQAPDGTAYSGYGGFTNFSSPVVQKYNVDSRPPQPAPASTTSSTTTSAARTGRCRRWSSRVSPAIRRPRSPASSPARAPRSPHGTFLGASVFGIAATRPDEIAQDVPSIAREVDYVAPMVYPSHWGPDEYGVAEPERAALRDRAAIARTTSGAPCAAPAHASSRGSRTSRSASTTARRRYERRSTPPRADGIDEFLLWDPRVTYTKRALDTSAALPTDGARGRRLTGGAGLVALRPSVSPDAPVADGLQPNELGGVPVIMYHRSCARKAASTT